MIEKLQCKNKKELILAGELGEAVYIYYVYIYIYVEKKEKLLNTACQCAEN